jgi:hypothetical protein
MYRNSIKIIICGDINNYLNDCLHKQQLDFLLASCYLDSTVQVPTRIHNNSASAIDNIYMKNVKFENFSVIHLWTLLSHHDAQILEIHNLSAQNWNKKFYFSQMIDKYLISDFNTTLSYESWDDIFMDRDVNNISNNFMNTYLRIFHSSFPLKKILS